MHESWGTFALGESLSSRRSQQLGLGAAIRHYNELSVPGIGGIWFAMPLIWSLIGIKIMSSVNGLPAIRVANAIEAKVMLEAIENGDSSNRILGRQKLPRQDISGGTFERMARANTYVTQPYRQACAQPLLEFGLVKSNTARFNSFEMTDRGETLLDPFASTVNLLTQWVKGKACKRNVTSSISPNSPLPKRTAAVLQNLILKVGEKSQRRRNIHGAFETLTSADILSGRISNLETEHVNDLKVGLALVRLRDLAIAVLNCVEDKLRENRDHGKPLKVSMTVRSKNLDRALNALHQPQDDLISIVSAGNHPDIKSFLRACEDKKRILQELVNRDKSVLLLRDGQVVPGPAFDPPRPNNEPKEVLPNELAPELPRLQRFRSLIDDLERSQ